ncbi:MAG: M23 family metallopeptidase [bacterium]|nr:M23 family metallopeptidase [bacterium]
MKKKSYSVIIVTGATSTNREFVISSKLIKNSIIAFSILLLVFGFVIFDYLTISFDKEKMERYKNDNAMKEETIKMLTGNIDKLNLSLKRMESYKEKIMVAVGLKSPFALKEVGSGGPDGLPSGTIQNLPGNVELPQPGADAFKRENIVHSSAEIAAKARQVEKSLRYVNTYITEQKSRIAFTPALWPTRGYLTDPFGMRRHPFTGKRSFHSGQDIATQHGNKVIATADGYVLVTERNNYLGNVIHIDHKFGFSTRYGHLASFEVKEGDRVKRGDVIGFVGNTGRSTAPHLHYEVIYNGKNQNPMKYIID